MLNTKLYVEDTTCNMQTWKGIGHCAKICMQCYYRFKDNGGILNDSFNWRTMGSTLSASIPLGTYCTIFCWNGFIPCNRSEGYSILRNRSNCYNNCWNSTCSTDTMESGSAKAFGDGYVSCSNILPFVETVCENMSETI